MNSSTVLLKIEVLEKNSNAKDEIIKELAETIKVLEVKIYGQEETVHANIEESEMNNTFFSPYVGISCD